LVNHHIGLGALGFIDVFGTGIDDGNPFTMASAAIISGVIGGKLQIGGFWNCTRGLNGVKRDYRRFLDYETRYRNRWHSETLADHFDGYFCQSIILFQRE
jgi:hypothetical protein